MNAVVFVIILAIVLTVVGLLGLGLAKSAARPMPTPRIPRDVDWREFYDSSDEDSR